MVVQSIVKDLYRKKTPTLFLKIDIAKAFNFVSWVYLLEVIDNLGFGTRWRDWISLTIVTSSSRILPNDIPGCPIKHERGLHQGDSISLMLFILAMDPLQRIHLATERGVFHPISPRLRGIKASLYADDTVTFVSPRK
jgi:hypothetical protein